MEVKTSTYAIKFIAGYVGSSPLNMACQIAILKLLTLIIIGNMFLLY